MHGEHKQVRAFAVALCAAGFLLLIGSKPAAAYMDPASQGFVLQAVIAACFGATLYLRRIVRNVR